jgi:hypothetical protein
LRRWLSPLEGIEKWCADPAKRGGVHLSQTGKHTDCPDDFTQLASIFDRDAFHFNLNERGIYVLE